MRYIFFLTLTALSFNLNGQSMKIDLGKALTESGKVYGSYCGFAGTHPPTRILLEELIAKKDMETLSSWLSSPNLVIQTYAAEAFIRLSSSDIRLADSDLALVEKIKLKQDKISTCTGCIYEGLTIEECLSQIKPNERIALNGSKM